MMRVLTKLTVIAGMLLPATAHAEAVWKTEAFAKQCQEVESGADEGQDVLFKKCSGLVPIWMLYTDSVRLSVGLGRNPHVSLEYMETGRGEWPVQWGGSVKGGKFVPRVAIIRFKGLEQPTSSLYVFRLLENGSSCVVGVVEAGSNQNAKAKAVAEKAMTKWKCLTEAVPVTS